MARYIDADAIPWTDLNDNPNSKIRVLVTFAEKVNRMPTADVRENVRGEWIKGGEQPYFRKHFDIVVCSKCNKRGEHGWNFCPNCGADMRKEEMSE